MIPPLGQLFAADAVQLPSLMQAQLPLELLVKRWLFFGGRLGRKASLLASQEILNFHWLLFLSKEKQEKDAFLITVDEKHTKETQD